MTSVYRAIVNTSLACDFAAPRKSTLAIKLFPNHFRIKAPPTTQQFTAVDTERCLVTLPSVSSQGPTFSVNFTIIGRVLRIHQIAPPGRFDPSVRNEVLSVVARNHFRSAVEAFLQTVPDFSKRWHLPPASPESARP